MAHKHTRTTTELLDLVMFRMNAITFSQPVKGGLPFSLLEMDLAAAIGEQLAESIRTDDPTTYYGWCN